MKRILFLVIAAALLLAACSTGTSGDQSWKKIQDKKEFILGFDDSFPPMGFVDEGGNYAGFDIDLATEVCNRLGITLKLQPIDWSAKEQELNSGNIDCIWNGMTITDERKQAMAISKPYLANNQVLVARIEDGYKTRADLAGKAVALQAGSSAADALEADTAFKASIKDGKPVELKENMIALMDLESGGVDAVLMDEIVARYYIETSGKNFAVLEDKLAPEEYGIAFRKGDLRLRGKIEETLSAMVKDGKMAEIATKWFGKDITVYK